MRTFSFIAFACLTVALLGGTRADAADQEAWCAYYDDNAGTNCGLSCSAASTSVSARSNFARPR